MANVVGDYHFDLPFLCSRVAAGASQLGVETERAARRQELILRMDRLAGGKGLIRGFNCAFGRLHHNESGDAVSGVE